jgi:hypothetical protein
VSNRPPRPDDEMRRVSALDRNTALWVFGLLAAGAAAVTAINLRRPAEPDHARAVVAGKPAAAPGFAMAGEDLPLPQGSTVDPQQGMLDIETSAGQAVIVDGKEIGQGPALRLTLAPGVHEVRLRGARVDQPRAVLIRASRRTRLVF